MPMIDSGILSVHSSALISRDILNESCLLVSVGGSHFWCSEAMQATCHWSLLQREQKCDTCRSRNSADDVGMLLSEGHMSNTALWHGSSSTTHGPSQCAIQEPFELLEDASGAMAPGVARHWRLRAEQSSCGAFHGLQVCYRAAHSGSHRLLLVLYFMHCCYICCPDCLAKSHPATCGW